MVIFAPVTTAPEESTTLPARLPRTDDSADPCATAGTVNAVSSASTTKAAMILLVIFDSFQNVRPHPLLSWAQTFCYDIENDRQLRYSALICDKPGVCGDEVHEGTPGVNLDFQATYRCLWG